MANAHFFAHTDEERAAEIVFERLYRMADGGLGEVELSGSLSEAVCAGYGLKGLELAEVKKVGVH